MKNAHTNFLTPTTPHQQPGIVFDTPITVRFTPVRHLIEPGDGTRFTTSQPARTWAVLGQRQFTETATSHRYTQRGTFTATLTTTWTAEASLDDGTTWYPVQGTLTTPATTEVTIYEVRTALVAHTCTEQPTAPGCQTP